jgi:hypothetical protein
MLSRVIAQWSAFDATCRSEAGSKNDLASFTVSDKNVIMSFLQILKPLKLATERLEGEKVPTVSNVLVQLKWLQRKLAADPTPSSFSSTSSSSPPSSSSLPGSRYAFPQSVSFVRQRMSTVLSEKMSNYLDSADFWIAAALDPRVSISKFTLFNCLPHSLLQS